MDEMDRWDRGWTVLDILANQIRPTATISDTAYFKPVLYIYLHPNNAKLGRVMLMCATLFPFGFFCLDMIMLRLNPHTQAAATGPRRQFMGTMRGKDGMIHNDTA